jgi:hypothetical protein
VIPDLDGGVLRVIACNPGLCVDCGNAVEAPALVIGDQWWCDPCMIATREALEHSFASWSESMAKLFSK